MILVPLGALPVGEAESEAVETSMSGEGAEDANVALSRAGILVLAASSSGTDRKASRNIVRFIAADTEVGNFLARN